VQPAQCEVEWFFDGGEVNDGEGISITDHGDGRHSIVITDCEEDDSGEYVCFAVNDHGKARSRGFLIVEGRFQAFLRYSKIYTFIKQGKSEKRLYIYIDYHYLIDR